MMESLQDNQFRGAATGNRRAHPAVITVVVLLAIMLLFHDTFSAMVATWRGSEVYDHGFLIFPISAWLIWDQRRRLALMRPRPAFPVVGLVALAGLAWLLAHLAKVPVGQQLALISLMILAVWAILGTAVVRRLLFPLGFLFFAVPMGEALIPLLVKFTTELSVGLLNLTGIIQHRVGTTFYTPGAAWVVTDLCSGQIFLAKTLAAGSLYVYLLYQSPGRRMLFGAMVIALPILANALRVFSIVMSSHLKLFELATVEDHILFGQWAYWAFIAGVFLIGFLWREPRAAIAQPESIGPDTPASGLDGHQAGGFGFAAVLVLVTAAVWPGLAPVIDGIEPGQASAHRVDLQAPAGVGGWRGVADMPVTARPATAVAVDAEFFRVYRKQDQVVMLYVGQFRQLPQSAADMLYAQNVKAGSGQDGDRKKANRRRIDLQGRTLDLIENRVDSKQGSVLAWNWYRFGDQTLSSRPMSRLWEVWLRLIGGRRDAALIMLATPNAKGPKQSEQVLRAFTEGMLPAIERALDRSVGIGGQSNNLPWERG